MALINSNGIVAFDGPRDIIHVVLGFVAAFWPKLAVFIVPGFILWQYSEATEPRGYTTGDFIEFLVGLEAGLIARGIL